MLNPRRLAWLGLLSLGAASFALARSPQTTTPSTEDRLEALAETYEDHTGSRVVFVGTDLPEGEYHDTMLPLDPERRVLALEHAIAEARKLPRGYLGAIGLEAVGIFEATISDEGDGFRPFNEHYQGYVYYGIWNGHNGIAAAYYTDEQLPLTFHHEVFHHVDGTHAGSTTYRPHFASDDERFAAAISGEEPYPAPTLSEEDRAALEALAEGWLLEDAVGDYASKSAGEDQAETARYFMTTLPDALLQVVDQPELPGSQRILHVIHQYEAAVPEDGPGFDWFVDVALGR